MKGHHIFFGLMAAASLVSMAKYGLLAAIYTPDDFAKYSAAFAFVALAASVTSFGLVEGTVKRFVRLIALGRTRETHASLLRSLRILCLRYLAILILPIGLLVYDRSSGLIQAAASLVALACSANLLSLCSSLLRGFDRLVLLGNIALLRNVCGGLIAALFGYLYGWQSGLLAEAMLTLALSIAIVYFLAALVARAPNQDTAADNVFIAGKADGTWLFLAFTLPMLPTSVDRAWVIHFGSLIDAAQYAFCGIWLLGAAMVASVYVQKFGPDMIRLRSSNPDFSILRQAFRHGAAMSLLMAAGTVASFGLLFLLLHDTYWIKYDLSRGIVAITTFAVLFQTSPLFDWALIALDRERQAFYASVIFVTAFVVGFTLCASLGAGAGWYIFAAGIARAIQIGTSISLIRGRQSCAAASVR